MKLPRSSRESKELGAVWSLVPLLSVLAALAAYVLLSSAPAMFADSISAQSSAGNSALTLIPSSIAEFAVPDAATVFKDRPYQVTEHVDAF